jgi:hypothetical protein
MKGFTNNVMCLFVPKNLNSFILTSLFRSKNTKKYTTLLSVKSLTPLQLKRGAVFFR